MSNYTPPAGDIIALEFNGIEYAPPAGGVVALEFSTESSEPVVTQYLFPNTIAPPVVPTQSIRLQYTYLYPTGFNQSVVTTPYLYNLTQTVKPSGWQSSNVGRPSQVVSYFKDVYPRSIDSAGYGRPLIFNLKQYKAISGFDAARYGTAYLQGGVKYLTGRGYDASAFGSVVVTNTTANQTVNPTGIKPLDIPLPDVSPRMLYPNGIASQVFGTPDVRSPVLMPKGADHSLYGNTTVWFHTRYLSPAGILSFETGYPKVFDPTQFVTQQPWTETTIFGDVQIKNKSVFIRPIGIFEETVTPWAVIENNRRYYKPNGIDSLIFGDTNVRNKTPSIFPEAIAPPLVSTPAIGYRIRSVSPAGFDHLSFGRPVLTKTPELLPKPFDALEVGKPTVWFKNRVVSVQNNGINSFKAGDATAWFRYRYVSPNSWQSSKFANPVLTHGLREVISQGFLRDAYGKPWISFGTRTIEPIGIETKTNSNHMVGGTRYIEPVGFIATLFGERVIPEIQQVSPIGFAGAFGLANIYLHTQYLLPYGFISVGLQPADRWGNAFLINKTQYVHVDYDSESGLNPPAWPSWTLIENRNKQLNITGFFSQRFGYAQIDNAAAPLLVTGIAPPVAGRTDVSMISHANRAIKPDGIEPQPMTDWIVVVNAAKVLQPSGSAHTLFGLPAVQNTRRSYSNIGQIDSQAFGLPMIAYRIRTIDIESRYGIAPPYINLPTVELSTRYIEPRGFDTSNVPLPALSVRFNIIAPSWLHRDYAGYPTVRNVTPEVGAYGHNSESCGQPSIRTQWRNVYAQGDRSELFGVPIIADTRRVITVKGWIDSAVSQKPAVTKTGTNPYVTQTIWLDETGGGGSQGIEPPKMPSPGVNQNVLYPTGFIATRYGTPKVHSNNIHVSVGIAIENIPVGPVVYNKKTYVEVEGIDATIKVSEEIRVSPNYILPKSFNHPGEYGDYKFGKAVLTLRDRTLTQRGSNSLDMGYPTVSLKTRYIKPPSMVIYGMGVPSIPFTPKTIVVFGFDSTAIGKPTIAPPPYTGPQTVSAKGFNTLTMDRPVIDLLHRTLTASGHDSLRMGASKGGDTPFMWQGLRIGERVPLIVGGDDMSAFGETRIGLRVRNIELTGFDTFECNYTLTEFRKRMKVIGSITDYTEQLDPITINGFDSMSMGNASITWGQQFIRPDGNSDQFRKGAF